MKDLIQNYVICYLQQDDPRRHLFRARPLFAWDGQTVDLVEGAETRFMADGYIRVIPDKQEQAQFVARMTHMRSLCALDLRGVTQEYSKIRTNKYYTDGGVDDNAYVVYSDVIKALPDGLIAQVFTSNEPPTDQWLIPPEYTLGANLALIRFDGLFHGPYYPASDGLTLTAGAHKIAYAPTPAELKRCLSIACDDFEADIFLDLAPFGLSAVCPPQEPLARIVRPFETPEIAEMSPNIAEAPLDTAETPPPETAAAPLPLQRQKRSVDERWRQSALKHMGSEHSAHDEILRTKIAVSRLFENRETRPRLVAMLSGVSGLPDAVKTAALFADQDAVTDIAAKLASIESMQRSIAVQYAQIVGSMKNFRQ